MGERVHFHLQIVDTDKAAVDNIPKKCGYPRKNGLTLQNTYTIIIQVWP